MTPPRFRLIAAMMLLGGCLFAKLPAVASPGDTCGGVYASQCGVDPDPGAGEFHGVIAVDGSSWVLGLSAHAGTTAGCGDCTWTVVLDCPTNNPSDPGSTAACVSSVSPVCPPGELLDRLYLTTDAVVDELEGTLCLGPGNPIVPVGDRAAIDVADYLKDVVPPDLVITTRPQPATLAGLPTYFTARQPADLAPAPFGGDGITEVITIRATEADWQWGDDTESGWVDPGASTPHIYRHGEHATGRLVTRWAATYTLTYAGETLGPYDAPGTLTKTQDFRIDVRTATQSLVGGSDPPGY